MDGQQRCLPILKALHEDFGSGELKRKVQVYKVSKNNKFHQKVFINTDEIKVKQ